MNEYKHKNYNGWDWIRDQMENCPYCNQKPDLGIDALSGKWMVACMNSCCSVMKCFINEYSGRAIVAWNKWVRENK